jgi:YegS/Rv2252/BmrU family lipid kinase
MSKKICFIVNPKSGTGDWKGIEKSISLYLDKSFTPTILHTERAEHATELAHEAAKTHDAVIAVGGDGMMNETATGLIGTNALLGIIPTGSGNALARHLGIPMSHKGAIECINRMHHSTIDIATINNKYFFAIAGTGYDAEIAAKFADKEKRGFWTYLKLSVANFFTYKAGEYTIVIDGTEYKRKAFLISVANSSQYGNNAYISPEASLHSGVLEACVLRPFSMFVGPILTVRMFAKSMHRSPYLEILKGKNIEIKKADNSSLCIHYDGETVAATASMKMEIKPLTLKVIFPEGKKI